MVCLPTFNVLSLATLLLSIDLVRAATITPRTFWPWPWWPQPQPKCNRMERFPPVTPSILTPEQKPLYELMDNVTKATYGTTIKLKSSDGALLGPFNPMLYTPTLITPWLQLQANIGALAVARDREIAILACLSQSPAPYGVYAHTIIAKKAGFTEDQVEAMLVARTPRGLGRREAMVWEFSLELTQMKGPMEKDTYKRAEKVLERDGIAALIHTVGAFMYTSVLLNAADVCAPE